ncbi:MscS Mechanosensitive ion channel [Psychromonas ingrahamii 37]|uniref:Small-conductance mechanosensitive channel n=1 Tax=Psychromonas ingrahamii (strain DSM 17664 / CCUG 51855 / 37) TaxID=357804 RepID=A1SVK3_PSYIN|nr:mechanosensitive ion channel domain-containing protein [Psychromonas ingrahamii]ABM03518.1 MscS Mechanosensitive ion channel [Psychromonas ingrahamii 37]
MQLSEQVVDVFFASLPSLSIFVFAVLSIVGCHWFFLARHPELGNERKFPIQILILALTIISVLAVVIALPINESSRNQIMGLIGILLSGIIAFSSTNVISNLMSGVLLRITKPFQTGDFIRVGDFFGRVVERGLFDTEIQSENREFVALPNTYLVNNPVSTIRKSGTIVSATLSLGYDLHHLQIEPLLIKAAEKSGLDSPFVYILELGNFSITYRISGLLNEVKGLLTARSNLFRSILETLHSEGIEIMSPAFMNQRKIDDGNKIIPTFIHAAADKKIVDAEGIVFDKAEQAAQIEDEKNALMDGIKDLEINLKNTSDTNRPQLIKSIKKKRERLEVVDHREVEENRDNSPGSATQAD